MQTHKNKGKRIGVAGNHSTTIDLITTLIRHGYTISCIINMASNLAGKIAGYIDLAMLAKKYKIKLIRPQNYSLKSDYDKKILTALNLDMLLVCGWQRLIPEWFLNILSIGAFGTHGSWKPLPYGRGRSLGNWGLLMGKDKILDNLFKYDAGADSGVIIDTLKFKLTQFDTIATVHHKDNLIFQTLLLKYLPLILAGKISYKPQPTNKKEVFFPKRTAEDGVIDWRWKTLQIYNLIRAVTKPYPGAFTFFKKEKIMIWTAIPFDLFPTFQDKKAGEIFAVFVDKTFVVKTQDEAILVQQYEAKKWSPRIGMIFISRQNKSFVKLRAAKII